MTITPYISKTSFLTTYLVNFPSTSILMGLSCLSLRMLDALKKRVILVSGGLDPILVEKKPTLERIMSFSEISSRGYPHTIESDGEVMTIYHHPTQNGLYCTIGGFVFTFDLSIGKIARAITEDSVILSSNSAPTTALNELRLLNARKDLLSSF